MKKILVLGGTSFIGRTLTEELIKTNNDITLFNRGKTNTDLFPDLKRIIGDRETDDIQKITKQNWDIIFDLSCYYPNSLEKLLTAINGKVGKYIFVSTVSVYDIHNQNPILENEKTFSCSEEDKTNSQMYTYGIRKAECERVLLKQENLDKVILRPALVYGKYDNTDRFYYWIYHLLKQEKVLIPDTANKSLINFTFVEDFAKLMIYTAFNQTKDQIYNATTHQPKTLLEIIKTIASKVNKNVELIEASNEFLNDNQIKIWSDIAFYLPYNMTYDNSKLINEIDFKVEEFDLSIEKTISYYQSINYPQGKSGISLEKEIELISKL